MIGPGDFSFLLGLMWRGRQNDAAIKRFQQDRLRRILTSAARLPYYQTIFADHKIDPATATPETLRRVPPMEKEDFRRLVNEATDNQTREGFQYWPTSGTSGVMLSVAMTSVEARRRDLLWNYGFRKTGLRTSEKLARLQARQTRLHNQTLPQRLGIQRQYVIDLRQEPQAVIDQLFDLQPDVVASYPSYLTLLAQIFAERNLTLPSLNRIVAGGEMVTPQAHEFLTSTFNVPVMDLYGCVEFGIMTFQCSAGSRHIIPDAVIVDVEAPDGSGTGDAIVTGLLHHAIPIIRYRLGDRLRLSDSPCACGVSSQIIDRIEGRLDDFVTLPSGTRLSGHAINVLDGLPGLLEFQAIQTSPETIVVKIRKSDKFNDQTETHIRQRILDNCLGEDIKIDVVEVDHIDRSGDGKLRAVISNL